MTPLKILIFSSPEPSIHSSIRFHPVTLSLLLPLPLRAHPTLLFPAYCALLGLMCHGLRSPSSLGRFILHSSNIPLSIPVFPAHRSCHLLDITGNLENVDAYRHHSEFTPEASTTCPHDVGRDERFVVLAPSIRSHGFYLKLQSRVYQRAAQCPLE